MDLADIRKKARTQRGTGQDLVLNAEVLPPQPIESDPPPLDRSETSQFWDEIGCEQFATDEEYAQGLVDVEEAVHEEQVQWLGFYLGAEEYALDIEVVSELIKPRELTELPQVPNYVSGIISLRGEVIPVVDLKLRLGLKGGDSCELDLQRILICETQGLRVGLLVDRVSQVVRLPLGEVETPQLAGDDLSAAFIQGIGRKEGRMLIQLRPVKAMEIEAGAVA